MRSTITTLLCAILLSAGLAPCALAMKSGGGRTRITPVHKKIGEGGLKGRQGWFQAHEGISSQRKGHLGDPLGRLIQFNVSHGLGKKAKSR